MTIAKTKKKSLRKGKIRYFTPVESLWILKQNKGR